MHPSTRRERRSTLARLLKQAAVAALAGALMFAGVAPAAAAPADDLAALIAHAETLVNGDYTEQTRRNLEHSIFGAETVLEYYPTDDAAVLDAYTQLDHFVGALVDLSQLRSAYASATKYGHPAHSWGVHESALVQARDTLDRLANPRNHADQSQIDQYTIELNASQAALVDLSALRAVYDAAWRSGDYTAASWAAFESQFYLTADFLTDATTSGIGVLQATVDAYKDALVAAQDALVDLSALRAVHAAASVTGDFTDVSWSMLSAALEDTELLLSDAANPSFDVWQADVDSLIASLQIYRHGLVDLSGLRSVTNNAMFHTRSNYLTHGWVRFEAARDAAVALLDLPNATAAAVATATQNLIDTEAALEHSGWLHEVLQTVAWKDEADYGEATWARFAATVAVLEAFAVRDLAGEFIAGDEVFDALNDFYAAEAGLLEMAPLLAAATDFASLTPAHYAPVTFGELAAIEAEIDRMITDSTDPAKVDTNGDGNWVPRYWAKRAEIVDIRTLTAVLIRVDGLDKSRYSAHSAAALDDHRNAVVDLLVNHSLTEGDVAGFIASLQGYESSLVSIGALIDAVAAAKALDEGDYTATQWAAVTAGVTAAEALLARAANPVEAVTSTEVSSANSTLVAAVAANGAPKPGTPASVNVTAASGGVLKNGSTVRHGSSVNIALSGLLPGSTVTVHLHSNPILLGTFTAALDGTVNGTVTIPGNAPAGNHNLVLSFTNADGTPGTHSIAVVIPLPKTGSDSPAPALLIGGLLLAVGGGLLVLRRRVAI
ncbi:LPXTG cell wall anchor domain-containing protein [Cryobacterium sp. BB736]|uniref:LPXTG cell wall anchor domain-containing protein n=1 Tax=Cryobacterium sp. BB736 TaxID=2746963 RepID=UPI001873DAA4|nr:LPXTG cell wall anchor domain-containing protein [Cryobacterium sp. BB736]